MHMELSLVFCDDLEGWGEGWGGREVQEEGDICIHIADSLHCIAGTQHVKQLHSNKKGYNSGIAR